ncbi:MAG: hypothetical protein JWP01_133 [Myxococcales bacterium]|nr:hypothetical protein [Myxococcales bacterium]
MHASRRDRDTLGFVTRVIVYDRTCVRSRGRLSPIWAAGARMYRSLGRTDDIVGVASWSEAFAWLAGRRDPISEIQYWGHGNWGAARVGDDVLDARALMATHPSHRELEAVRERLAPDALLWFRTCETFGARAGRELAMRLADFLGARVAGHTYVIGFHQSGLHGLAPGTTPDWSPNEGLAEGTADAPRRAKSSRPWAARTITCLTGHVPAAWFAGTIG